MAAKGRFAAAHHCLHLTDPSLKCDATARLWADMQRGGLTADDDFPVDVEVECGRPERPELVPPARLPKRRLGTDEGRAALIHAIAHIEFNAINLALDAACRFTGMPDEYYLDWVSVAADEARHYTMLASRLASLGHAYGEFPAHDGLWEMARRTGHDCLTRMALVPRVLEARGLDVTPGMIGRLEAAGDDETCRVLDVILEEEVRHVAVGTRWFRWCCEREGKCPEATFLELLEQYYGAVPGPLNIEARREAGFTPSELAAIGGSSA